MVNRLFHIRFLKYWGILLFLGLWLLLKVLFFAQNQYLPYPHEAIWRMLQLLASGDLLPDFQSTAQTFLTGFGLAIAFGVPIGLWLGYSKRTYATFEVMLDFFRSIPVTALFPIFILFFGISLKTITAMVTVACLFVIILNSAYGVLYVNKTYLKVAKSLGATRWQTFSEVIFFEALPFLLVGLRVAVSFGLIVVVVSEMFIGTRFGLGSRVYIAHETYLITDVYALTILIGIIGYGLNQALLYFEKKTIHWKGHEKAAS